MRILLLVCFYSPIYPSAFMFGAAVLIIQYWMDKFCLVVRRAQRAAFQFFMLFLFSKTFLMLCVYTKRSWARQAMIGGKLAAFIRTYFFSTLIVIWTVSASYFWSGFSFDNVCGEFHVNVRASVLFCNITVFIIDSCFMTNQNRLIHFRRMAVFR